MSSVKKGLRFAGRFLAVDGAIATVDRFGRRSVGVVGIDQEVCSLVQRKVRWTWLGRCCRSARKEKCCRAALLTEGYATVASFSSYRQLSAWIASAAVPGGNVVQGFGGD